MDIDHIVERGRAGGFLPDIAGEHLTRHHLVLVAEEVFEERKLTQREIDDLVPPGHPAGDQVHLQVPRFQAEDLIHPTPAEQCPHAGEKFWKGKRLDEIIIRTTVQSQHAVLDRVFGGQNHDRCLTSPLAERCQHLHPVSPWQHQVKDHHVEGLCLDREESFFARLCHHDGVVLGFQTFLQGLGDLDVIFNDKNTHTTALCSVNRDGC